MRVSWNWRQEHNQVSAGFEMNTLSVNGQSIEVDKEGFLKHLSDWNEIVAEALAKQEGIELSDAHWEILELLKTYYQQFQQAPSMRPMVKWVKQNLGTEKGNSMYLMRLFPESPAKQGCKIAGLPRPTNCF